MTLMHVILKLGDMSWYLRPAGGRDRILVGTYLLLLSGLFFVLSGPISAQSKSGAAELGSQTARNGFRNEDEIAAKFNSWRTDEAAKIWLAFMSSRLAEIESVAAVKPHGEKADIQVRVRTKAGEKVEGISIKLVSSTNGFNQIDKRWVAQYVKMWKMPADVEAALRLFVGETKPGKSGRTAGRIYINEFDAGTQKKIVEFFEAKKDEVVSDMLRGEGPFSAGWMLVALKSDAKPRWVLRSIDHVIKYYSDGPVVITRNGNLKIGRITMQRKGGDGGRETAKMLQFKINPALLFSGKQ